MFDIENNVLIKYNGNDKQTSVVVPEGVTEIASSAFFNTEIEFVKLPNSIQKIGYGAFKKCANLQEINLPESLSSIGAEAFWGCSSLKEVRLPESVDAVLQETFRGCGFAKLEIPKSVKSVFWGAFRRCSNLEEVLLEDGVEVIGESSFESCNILKHITIPASVSEIASTAFFLSDNVSFIVYKGTYGEKFAIENNIKYTLL